MTLAVSESVDYRNFLRRGFVCETMRFVRGSGGTSTCEASPIGGDPPAYAQLDGARESARLCDGMSSP
jgi:hypothetical protein